MRFHQRNSQTPGLSLKSKHVFRTSSEWRDSRHKDSKRPGRRENEFTGTPLRTVVDRGEGWGLWGVVITRTGET